MKRIQILFVIMTYVFVSSVVLTVTPVFSETKVLRWSHPSANRGSEAEIMKWLSEEFISRTDGRVKIQVYWAQTLCKQKEMAEATKTGLVDVGWVTPAYTPGYGELTGCMHAGSLFNPISSPVEFTKRLWRLFDENPDYYAEFERQNMIPIYPRYYDVWWFFSNKPIRNVEDMKGVKIRAVSEAHQVACRAVGASPVFLPSSEIYSALQKNILDATSSSPDTALRLNYHTVTKYLTRIDLMPGYAYWSLNLDTFKKLSPIDQKTVLELGREASMKMAGMMEIERNKALEEFRKVGMEVINFPEAEKVKWQNKPEVREYSERWVADKEAKGLPARKALNQYYEVFGIKKGN